MAKTFAPKDVLRQISNELLCELFGSLNADIDVPWDDLRETDVDRIYREWQDLPESACRSVEIVLHEVAEMADGDEGIRVIVEEFNHQGQQDLLEQFDQYDSRHDKALWTYLNARDVWDMAVLFARADSLARGRYWIKRGSMPVVEPNTSREAISALEAAVSHFFRERQSRGRYCQIDHYVRASGVYYFFAYLDDYADTYVALDDEGSFDRRPERRAFEVVFAYDAEHGTLEMYARGGKRVYVPLQELFSRLILGEELGPETNDSHPYRLNGLINRDFEFPTDPDDGIMAVRVRKLELTPVGRPRRGIVFKGDPGAGYEDVYDMMEEYLKAEHLSRPEFDVKRVGLQFTFDTSIEGLPRSMSFEISAPNSCNLKSKPEAARVLAEKYLREWGIDCAAAPTDAQRVDRT